MADELPKASEVAEAVAAAPADEAVADPRTQQIDEAKESTKSVKELLDEGNADLALAKYPSACEFFSLAVEKLVSAHGEMSIQTVDALEVYGNALLKNAIASSAVLGNDASAPKTDATAPSTSKGETSTAKAKAGPSNQPLTAQNINFHFGGDEPDEEEDDDEEEEGEGEDGADDADDFENAWEILDSARAILAKEDSTERKLQLARVHSSMAEVATESGRPEDGVKEYEQALAIQSALLPKWDRLVAQTHLFIALALELIPNNQFDSLEEETQVAKKSYGQAMEHVEKAKEILRAREAHLKGADEESDKGKGKEGESAVTANGSGKDLSDKEKEELQDITELLVELDNKIDDFKAQSEEAEQKLKEGGTKLQEKVFQSGPALPENVSREVHNLNSMVKKKKKQPPAPAAADAGAPAAQTAATPAGEQSSNGINGKRKAEDETADQVKEAAAPVEKRVRIQEPTE